LNKHIKTVHESMNQFYPEVSLDDKSEGDYMISSIHEIKKEELLDESCLDEKEPQVYQSEMN